MLNVENYRRRRNLKLTVNFRLRLMLNMIIIFEAKDGSLKL